LVILAIIYAANAVKGHVNTANTLEALFAGIKAQYLDGFSLVRPSVESLKKKRGIRSLKVLQAQFDHIEAKIIRMVYTLNPKTLNSNN
jgi:hypothetical protein